MNENDPTWLTKSKKNFLDSIIYTPKVTIGHINRAGKPDEFNSPMYSAGLKREKDFGHVTNELFGLDLFLMKMSFKRTDLESMWPELIKILDSDASVQKEFFSHSLDGSAPVIGDNDERFILPRTDERVNSYFAGYPSNKTVEPDGLAFSWGNPETSGTSSMKPYYVVGGSNSDDLNYLDKFNKEYFKKYYSEYSEGGRFNGDLYNEKDLPSNFNHSKLVNNEKAGMWTSNSNAVTTTFLSGNPVTRGFSGSMVLDANFRNYGIVFAQGTASSEDAKGITRVTLVANFIQEDPYSKSQVDGITRPSVRLELENVLKAKFPNLKTLVLNK
ncbi:hypothetical protein EI74_0226 [Mycoplasma testudineum]|uniref:Uncharacterized protein n=1 Tax=Mycoplasma testudineum TaxID=244584 RepID=A0A4R6IHT6_9MOLU|nr:hypothetical protein [Mycoplasma testudineum]OYD27050.1 hypothetical protein CG473_00145 [Mycoplasma testudineum]TDO21195.1 hypothetical protein EI74_0226 [Mycoplasma testudineum]